MTKLAIVVFAAIASPSAAASCGNHGQGDLLQVHQDFSSDPGWEGVRNRLPATFPPRVMQRFGWSLTNHAGKEPGEVGGYIQSTTRPAWYAKVIERRTMEATLSFSGSFSVLEARAISGWHTLAEVNIGFFNSAEQGWRPKNFIGFRLAGSNEPDGALVELHYGTSSGAAGGVFLKKTGSQKHEGLVKDMDIAQMLRIAPDAARHSFACRYDPAANGGRGEIALTIDEQSWSLPLREEHRKVGATFDRFGIFNQQIPGRAMVVYFDDLEVNGQRDEFTAEPRWEGKGNNEVFEDAVLYGTNDFGYSPTSFAGRKAGEIGGRFWRVNEPEYKAWYGTDVGALTLNDRLEAGGRICIRRFSIDSGMHIGFFNSAGQGWPPRNFVGAYLDSYTPGGRFFMPMYGTATQGEHLPPENSPFFIDDGRAQDFAIVYDPQANNGGGAVTVTLGARSATLPLPAGARPQGAAMNRFGLFNMQDNNGKHSEVYLDDLVYTSRTVRRP